MAAYTEYISDLGSFQMQACLNCDLAVTDENPELLGKFPKRYGKRYCPIARLANEIGHKPTLRELSDKNFDKNKIPDTCGQDFNNTVYN